MSPNAARTFPNVCGSRWLRELCTAVIFQCLFRGAGPGCAVFWIGRLTESGMGNRMFWSAIISLSEQWALVRSRLPEYGSCYDCATRVKDCDPEVENRSFRVKTCT